MSDKNKVLAHIKENSPLVYRDYFEDPKPGMGFLKQDWVLNMMQSFSDQEKELLESKWQAKYDHQADENDRLEKELDEAKAKVERLTLLLHQSWSFINTESELWEDINEALNKDQDNE